MEEVFQVWCAKSTVRHRHLSSHLFQPVFISKASEHIPGIWYKDFSQTTDEEVQRLLETAEEQAGFTANKGN
jgi:predicted phosphoribosyltransferase